MKIDLRIAFIIFIIATSFNTHGQNCSDFHLAFCPIPDFSYYYNQQSRSFSMKVGESKELMIVAYEKTDYYISICKNRKFNTLRVRIFDENSGRSLLYDNASDSYADTLKFTNEVTRRLIIELSLPVENNDKNDDKARCAGILIATKMHED